MRQWARPGRQPHLDRARGGGGHPRSGAALTFASGMAASQAVLELVEPGATVVPAPCCYLGVAAAVEARAIRYGWTVRRVDVADTEAVLAAADGADLVWLESPTNPTMEVADLPRIGQELGGRVRLVVDNTFATPLLQRPLEHGANLVVHSMTKLLSGHSDVLLGAVVARPDDAETLAALAEVRHSFGPSQDRWRPTCPSAASAPSPSGWAGPSRTPRSWPSGWRGTGHPASPLPGTAERPGTSGRAGR